MYLKILACKSQGFLGNTFYTSFHQSIAFTFAPGFVANSYQSHHLWLDHCCWPVPSHNSCHKQLELFIFLVQECMVKGWFIQSQSFFQFLNQCPTEAEIRWRTFCQIRWSENGTWFYCLLCGDTAYPYMTSWNFPISRYRKLDS